MKPFFCRHHRKCRSLPALIVLSTASFLSTTSFAQTAGQWSYKVGETLVMPKVGSGDLSGPGPTGIKLDVGRAYAPIVSGSYMLTDHVAAELILSAPFRHDITGKGTYDGVGKIASMQMSMPSLFLQYRFQEPTATLRPYLGAGVTYAHFSGATTTTTLDALLGPTSMSVDDRLGLAAQIGAIYRLNDRWFIDANVTKTFLKTRFIFTSGCTERTLEARLDPVSINVSVGYQF